MDKPPETANQGMKLMKVTKEERSQLAELRQEKPWQLTLRLFLARICSEYGFSLCEGKSKLYDPWDRLVTLPYLKAADGRIILLPDLGDLGLEDMLKEDVTGSLCRRIGIPEEDFGLQPEEPYDGDD